MLTERIGKAAMLEQTAEECSELAQACLKMARYIRGENKVHKQLDELVSNLAEESVDVYICIAELRLCGLVSNKSVEDWADSKIKRMAQRLKEDK